MRYKCGVCGYIYDDDKEAVPFDQLPDDWKCPVCGEGKEGFEPMDDEAPASKGSEKADLPEVTWEEDEGLRELSAGQLSAICSNLARGCSKQHLDEEYRLFTEIAEYYERHSVKPEGEGLETILELLNRDLGSMEAAKFQAATVSDRGALRVLTWAEKVSMMAKSIIEQYRSNPDFLDNTNVYVCDICGFIYIGDEPPAICPVCKVPGFLILKVKRRV